VQQQQLGYVTELNVNAISTTIQNFLNNPQEAQNMGYRSRQFILDNYTWDKIALKIISVYQDITSISPNTVQLRKRKL
jgi:glycosyltransferase involved in cell wall biosynthesis